MASYLCPLFGRKLFIFYVMRPKVVPLGYKFAVITTYLSTPHSIKFTFLEYEVFYLAI